jgi:hypothetical protein
MRRFYGHPSRFQARAPLSAPRLEHDGGARREIVAEELDTDVSTGVGSDVERKYEYLGYA